MGFVNAYFNIWLHNDPISKMWIIILKIVQPWYTYKDTWSEGRTLSCSFKPFRWNKITFKHRCSYANYKCVILDSLDLQNDTECILLHNRHLIHSTADSRSVPIKIITINKSKRNFSRAYNLALVERI
jgi:hypothetical protein